MNIPLLAIVLREMLDREEEKLYKQGPWQSCQKRKRAQNRKEKNIWWWKSHCQWVSKHNPLEYDNGKDGKSYWCKAHSTVTREPQAFQLREKYFSHSLQHVTSLRQHSAQNYGIHAFIARGVEFSQKATLAGILGCHL